MSQQLFTQSIATALAGSIGVHGVDAQRLDHYASQLPAAWKRLSTAQAAALNAVTNHAERDDDLAEIEAQGQRLAQQFKTLVVVGMGGSSLAAEVLAALAGVGAMKLFVLDNIDPHRFEQVAGQWHWPETAFLIVSKSGGTIEVQALLAALLAQAEKRQLAVAKHFFCITIGNGNAIEQWARENQVHVIAHDADLCGRFSILSNVGLIPAAAMGVDIRALRAGARVTLAENEGLQGPAAQAAALAIALMDQGIAAQVLMHYVDRLEPFARWVRQCWAESLGKDGQGTLLVPSRGTTDQHSQLQLYLDGPADKYFTALMVDVGGQGPQLGTQFASLRGARMGDLLMAEQQATIDALVEHGCPLRTLTLNRFDATVMGALLMHVMLETLYTAALMDVNPFDQPAVEAGKKKALVYLAGSKSDS